jgi:hypothetical protein
MTLRRCWFAARIALAMVLVAGCTTAVQVQALNASPRPLTPRPADEVEVISTGRPTRPMIEVAQLTSGPDRAPGDRHLARLRAKAAELGCDALVLRYPVTREPIDDLGGTCVMWVDPAAPSRERYPVPSTPRTNPGAV